MATTQQQKTQIDVKSLFEAGVHYGHQTHSWNPKMRGYIHSTQGNIHIMDLGKTAKGLEVAVEFIEKMFKGDSGRKPVLFVGTKNQAKEAIVELAESCGEFHMANRWPGGTLTNSSTMKTAIKNYLKLGELLQDEVRLASFKKKEISLMQKEYDKLHTNFCGIAEMRKTPGLLFVVDTNREHNAILEAKKLGIPVMAIVDTNCDPDLIDFPIAGNDDGVKSIRAILEIISSTIARCKPELQGAPKNEGA